VYYYLVTDFSNLDALSQIVWSFKVSSYTGHLCTLFRHVDGVVQLHIFLDVSYIS
ncbi:hypothetical protein M405DRAFT_725728, partial [Rhizopogon salebrosus TDB-379]